MSQVEKGTAFRALHEGEPFVIPNPWDAGSARVLESLGFKALATTSSGFAYTLGRADGEATLDEVIDHVRVLSAATSLPVSVDLENGHGPAPANATEAIARAAEAGAVGGSIEDYDPGEDRVYDRDHAAERVAAAAKRRTRCRSRSRSPRARRTTSAATPTSTTRSPACRPTRRRAPTCSTRPACAAPTRCARSARPSRSRSTCSATAA